MDKIKVVICDDAKFLCEGFCEQFAECDDIEVIATANSAQECIDILENNTPDILLLDIRMETETAGIDVIPELKKKFEDLKIIMLTSYNDDSYIFAAFANGADDYCEKSLSFDEIVDTIKNVYSNTASLRPEIAKKLINKTREMNNNQQSLLYMYNKISRLSTGEFELLRSLYYGSTYKNISKEKFVEIDSVRKMAKRLLKRMDTKSMPILIEQLRELKIFDLIDHNDSV